jgi:GDP-L-fucose synthase
MTVKAGFELKGRRVWVAGHRGLVGAALVRRLEREDCQILIADRATLDLRDQRQTHDWILTHRPDAIFMAAARVGGILANQSAPGPFLYDNLAMTTHVIEGARLAGVGKLLFLGSSCIYPKWAPQPIVEDSLLTGPLEPTNEWYAIAKIAGIKMVQAYRRQYGCDFISAMPTNLYGPGDNFDEATSHVLPALIRKAHDAKRAGAASLEVWGTGTPRREFLHVDDCADALVFLMKTYSDESHINVGSGVDLEVGELARLVAEIVGFRGRLAFDPSKPDGTPRKLMSPARLQALGWRPQISLREGIAATYRWFLDQASPEGARASPQTGRSAAAG